MLSEIDRSRLAEARARAREVARAAFEGSVDYDRWLDAIRARRNARRRAGRAGAGHEGGRQGGGPRA
jgi:hypothetical protein